MLRCPHCTRIYDTHVERCERHGALEPCDAVLLGDMLAQSASVRRALSVDEVLALLDAALRADSFGGAQLSPKQVFVTKGGALSFAGYAGKPLEDALDDALHDPLDVSRVSASEREAYRVAALAYELFAKTPAYFAKNARAVVVRKRLESAPSLADVRPDLPLAVCSLVTDALDVRRANQGATAAAFVAALREAAAQSHEFEAGVASASAAPAPAPQALQARAAMAPSVIAPTSFGAPPPMAMEMAAAPSRARSSVLPLVAVLAAVLVLAGVAGALFLVSGTSRRAAHEDTHSAMSLPSPNEPSRPRDQGEASRQPGTAPVGATTMGPTNAPMVAPVTASPVVSTTGASRAVTVSGRITRRARGEPDAADQSTARTDEVAAQTAEAGVGVDLETAPAVGAPALGVGDGLLTAQTRSDVSRSAAAPSVAGQSSLAGRRTASGKIEDDVRQPINRPRPQSSPRSWLPLAAVTAVVVVLILCALFLLRRNRRPTVAPEPIVVAPQPASDAAARASLVATRNSITDSVQVPHPAYSQTLPASAATSPGGAVDALARTEVVDSTGVGASRTSGARQKQTADFRPFSIGPYECFEQLGEGAMGIVYKARHEKLRRLCAVKVLVPDLAERPDSAAQFRREAELAASVQHPNTVIVYDFGELEGGLLYLVMELLEGRTLEALLRERRPSQTEALELVRQLSDGLDALHSAGIVHQDLKPQNVMVLERESPDRFSVKIVDFGLARLVGADPIEAPSGGRRISGTPLYMAPEQARADDRIGPSADLFALAVVAYEVIAGIAPFELDGRTVSQVVLERASGNYHPRPTGRASLDSLFEEGLAQDPLRRPPSARAFYAKMSAAVAA